MEVKLQGGLGIAYSQACLAGQAHSYETLFKILLLHLSDTGGGAQKNSAVRVKRSVCFLTTMCFVFQRHDAGAQAKQGCKRELLLRNKHCGNTLDGNL